ncbi:MAG: glycoside hydrolase family 2 TIM barrel-domain containing protein [Pseudothermotoga sp.]
MRITLDRNWKVVYENGASYEKISLPHEFAISEKSYPNPIHFSGLYERVLVELKGLSGKRIFLRFHGIDYLSRIFVNGKEILEHENGYDLFEVEITNFLNFDGQDLLQIHVSDVDVSSNPSVVMGKQDWYGNACGVLQQVELWLVDETFIRSAKFTTMSDLKTIRCDVVFSDGREHPFHLTIFDPTGEEIFRTEQAKTSFIFVVDEPKLWSVESPNLYTAVINFDWNGCRDQFKCRFGIRTISVEADKILLNGEPIYIFGALDQNFYPVTHYVLPKRNELLSELLKAKEMGLNLLRFHVKIPDDLYLDLADELGLLVWMDLPYARQLNEESKAYLERLLENLLERHANHPSFVILSLINESWGVDLSTEETRKWLKAFYMKAKSLDPTRLYVDNSACCGNLHVLSDIDDYHFYHSFPHHNNLWKQKVETFATGQFKSFTESKQKLPKLVSEFGVWGLSDQKDWLGNWMNFPVTVMGMKFDGSSPQDAVSLTCRFHNLDDFFYQSQLHQFLGLKYQIEQIRLKEEISGYVITEFSDIAWEANGLLDYNRMPKAFYSKMKFLNNSILPIIRDHKSVLRAGERYIGHLCIANSLPMNFEAKIVVRTDTKTIKQMNLMLKKWSVTDVLEVNEILDEETQNIYIEVFDDKRLVSRNFYPVAILQPKSVRDEIVWMNDESFQDDELICVSEKYKVHGFLELSGDWISNITVFNTKRNVNIAALLWALGDVASQYLLLRKDGMQLNSEDSLISRIAGWGYAFASLLYVKESKEGRKIYTTLKDCELSRLVIGSILL